MYVRMYVCVYVCVCACVNIYIYTYVYTCSSTCIFVCIYVRKFVRMCVCVYVCICSICIHGVCGGLKVVAFCCGFSILKAEASSAAGRCTPTDSETHKAEILNPQGLKRLKFTYCCHGAVGLLGTCGFCNDFRKLLDLSSALRHLRAPLT